jgi:hypothetical protein
MIIVPFTDNDELLFLHAMLVPTLLVHWYFNNNTCALTLLEQKFRELSTGIKDENFIKDGFLTKLINPIYDFPKNNETYSDFVYSLTILLWAITLYKLYSKYKDGNMLEINKKIDLIKVTLNKYIK